MSDPTATTPPPPPHVDPLAAEAMPEVAAEHVAATGQENPNRVTFDFDGKSYPLPSRFDGRVAMAMNRGDVNRAMELLIGKKNVEEVMAAETDEIFDPREFNGLIQRWAAALGVDLGE